MIRSTIVASLAAGFLLSAIAVSARADVAPDPNSADAHCTLEEQCAHGTFCDYAFTPGDTATSEQVGAGCRAQVATQGLEERCRNGSLYTGKKLYCPPGEQGTWSAGSGISCSMSYPSTSGSYAGLCLGVLGLAAVGWGLGRRRRNP